MTNPASQPDTPASANETLLLEFLRSNDAGCPVCGYNLRALTRPTCPECKQQLALTVGVPRLRLAWLFASLAPGFFSGIAAFFLMIPILGRVIFGDGIWTIGLIVLDFFGWCSGFFAIFLAVHRNRFLAQSAARQRWMTLAIWLIHLTFLVMFILVVAQYA